MEESGVYDNSGTNQNQPTTTEPGPAGGGAGHAGANAGGNKRDAISSSPTIGHTIAGRNLDGEGITEQEADEPSGGINAGERVHLDHE